MSPLLPYVPPSKGLLRTLQAEVQALAHQRLAQHLCWYQLQHGLDDEQIAQQMNACAAVIGIRARTDDAVHAPISEAKIARFKDGVTRPQRQTLEQMTAFFGDKLDAKPFLYWADMDDVLTAFHDARRFRKQRVSKSLLALTEGWLRSELDQPKCSLMLQISPMNAAPVILVRGRVVTRKLNTETGHHDDYIDVFVHGYGTLTPKNFNLYVRDDQGRQIIVTMDVIAGPFEDDRDRTPELYIKQTTLSLPPALDPTDRSHPYRIYAGTKMSDEEIKERNRRRAAGLTRPEIRESMLITERNAGSPDFDHILSFATFAIEPGKSFSQLMLPGKSKF
jgi:hypothetical protein